MHRRPLVRRIPGHPVAGAAGGGAPATAIALRKSVLVIEPLTCIFATNEG
jgi:hypothetical protein